MYKLRKNQAKQQIIARAKKTNILQDKNGEVFNARSIGYVLTVIEISVLNVEELSQTSISSSWKKKNVIPRVPRG